MKLEQLGVTPQKETQFKKKGILSVEDLVQYLPIRYNDFTKETGILPENQISCLIVQVDRVSQNYGRTENVIAFCTVVNTGEKVAVWWFNQGYIYSKISNFKGLKAFVAGKVKYNPQYDSYSISSALVFEQASLGKQIQPVYSKVPGMADEYLRDKIRRAFDISGLIKETAPSELISKYNLLNMRETLYHLHFPASMEQVKRAKDRLIFDDLLYFALQNERAAREFAADSPYDIKSYELIQDIKEKLPFSLTRDQADAVVNMLNDVKGGRRLNALVQGDVGCGKSIVAFLMMAGFVESGFQAAIMAPTQVLAHQHWEDLKTLVEPLGYTVAYLSTERKQSELKKEKERIADGTAQFIVGTSSVIGKNVEYKNLALTIVDEEHRFGVAQREGLSEKAAAGVHTITMSATPIPRSLAQVMYGNTVQLHTIHSMPEGRKPVLTGIQPDRARVYRFIAAQVLKHHHQAYVVCPMIDANDDMAGVKSVEEVSQEYRAALEPLGVKIATLTGRDKKVYTEGTIQAFKKGEIDVLISTSVIEVGVNVPNATAMIITNAERFGLSSLHQLRGRVGRSDLQSYCVLESTNVTEKGQQRLEAMCQTTDGFEIAEADLAIRGSGDILGTKQSGENRYMTLMLAFPDRYQVAQLEARDILDKGTACLLAG